MPVSSETSISGPYFPNGVTKSFAFEFKATAANEVIAVDQDGSTISTALYSVSLDEDEGGTLTFGTAPQLADYSEIYVVGDPALTQPSDFDNAGPSFNPAALTRALDRAAARDLKIMRQVGRALLVPFGEEGLQFPAASDRANKYVSFLPDGSLFMSGGTGADLGLRGDLASAVGGALVGFQQLGAGAILRDARAKARETVSVLDFGAVPDGVTGCSAAIAAAVDSLGSGGGDVLFPRGSYWLDAILEFENLDNVHFIGQNASISGAALKYYFDLVNCDNIAFEGLLFDARMGDLPPYSDIAYIETQVPIHFSGGSGLSVRRCIFTRLYTNHVSIYGASNIHIVENYFSSPLRDQNLYAGFIVIQTGGGIITVDKNRFIGASTAVNDRSPCAVSMAGAKGQIVISSNFAWHCGRNNAGNHRLGVFDLYADTSGVTVVGNVALHCREQFMRCSTSTDLRVLNNTVTIAAEADTTYSSILVESGSWPLVTNASCQRIAIRGNSVTCLGNKQAFAIGVASYDWGALTRDIDVSDNVVKNHDKAFVLSGPFRNVAFSRNSVSGVRAFLDMTLTGGLTMTTVMGAQAASLFDGLRIDDNEIEIQAGSSIIPVSLSTSAGTQYTGTVGDIAFRRNRLSGAPSGTSIAVNLLINASVKQGSLEARGNTIRGYATPFYLRAAKRAALFDNIIPGMTALYLSDGSMDLIEARGNRLTASAPLSGQAPLIAGTRTITTAEILAGDRVRVWREVPGGTLGYLSCNPANHVAGTSIRIDSSNAADTSTVGWEIVGR